MSEFPTKPSKRQQRQQREVADVVAGINERASAQEADCLPMDYKLGQLRDMAEQAGVADVFPDEANFALNAISMMIEHNAYTPEEGDSLLLQYVMRYCVERTE